MSPVFYFPKISLTCSVCDILKPMYYYNTITITTDHHRPLLLSLTQWSLSDYFTAQNEKKSLISQCGLSWNLSVDGNSNQHLQCEMKATKASIKGKTSAFKTRSRRFVCPQADWATALTLWCRSMEVSAAIRPRVGGSPRRAPSISSVSRDTTSTTRSVCPGAATGGGCLRYPPASPPKVRVQKTENTRF